MLVATDSGLFGRVGDGAFRASFILYSCQKKREREKPTEKLAGLPRIEVVSPKFLVEIALSAV